MRKTARIMRATLDNSGAISKLLDQRVHYFGPLFDCPARRRPLERTQGLGVMLPVP
jgi:hypothetical protein